jgi:cation-transporting ATPase 13A2
MQIEDDPNVIVDRFLSVITIAVPPALPAAMNSGVAAAIYRLRLSKIYCIQPSRMNLTGTITTIVFDKTGTITEEGLSVLGCRVVKMNTP